MTDWTETLIKNGDGKRRALFANAALALREAPEWMGVIAFDDFAKRTMAIAPPPWEVRGDNPVKDWQRIPWTPHHDLQTCEWLQQNGVMVSLNITDSAVEMVAHESAFHPVRDYLDDIKWDGVGRLDGWIPKYLGAADTEYTRAVSRCTLIGAVARIFMPGAKVDHVPIFEGLQGSLKSTMVETMFKPWFSDEMPDIGSKDGSMAVAGVWAIELGELDAMTKPETNKIKLFIARKIDRFRPPYGRRIVEFPRQNVFWGTTNGTNYLKDETGGRRYWPVECGKFDIVGLAEVRDQLWAEACHGYRAGKGWWLGKAETVAAAQEQQGDRYVGDIWTDAVMLFIGTLASTTVPDILTDDLNVPTERQGQVEANRVSRILRANGWARFQRGSGVNRQWRYRQADPTTRPTMAETKF
jgi:predicted P-loop ATPase